mmetsp:Transcript_7041/g.21893  ORF Transcript_7041/g.21893 Transcript_7041/m.21893 type:complete len:194 (+) Transcript_7041:22-603(+)
MRLGMAWGEDMRLRMAGKETPGITRPGAAGSGVSDRGSGVPHQPRRLPDPRVREKCRVPDKLAAVACCGKMTAIVRAAENTLNGWKFFDLVKCGSGISSKSGESKFGWDLCLAITKQRLRQDGIWSPEEPSVELHRLCASEFPLFEPTNGKNIRHTKRHIEGDAVIARAGTNQRISSGRGPTAEVLLLEPVRW